MDLSQRAHPLHASMTGFGQAVPASGCGLILRCDPVNHQQLRRRSTETVKAAGSGALLMTTKQRDVASHAEAEIDRCPT
jgi:hypothetical protein